MHALARHLGTKQTITVKGLTFGKTRTEGRTYFLTVSIPTDGIVVTDTAQPTQGRKAAEGEKIDMGNFQGLLTAKDDHVATLRTLSSSLLEQLPPKPTDVSREGEFYKAIADLEERAANGFASLRKEVQADKRLLQMEVTEVVTSIEKEETAFIERLKQQVDEYRATKTTKKE